jgi:hypothetical protein
MIKTTCFLFFLVALCAPEQAFAMGSCQGPVGGDMIDTASGKKVGGRCEYRTYSGHAVIVSMEEASEMTGRFDVRFRFIPEKTVKESFADPEGKIFQVQTSNFQLPDRTFLEARKMQEHAKIPCLMDVVQSGSCTPVIFRYPLP